MQDTLSENLKKLKTGRKRKNGISVILLLLSLAVVLDVFWLLRQTGITLAGDAACGMTEHTHTDECFAQEMICGLEEHVHSIGCYSDRTADTETPLDWQAMFADYPYTGDLRRDLAGIAQMQAGYTESALNFDVDADGVRRGYTRYGAWYGMPYGDWSAMFVSFCLHYAGADSGEYPGNTGAASMAAVWEDLGNYMPAGEYDPCAGDLVFFADNTVGIVTEVYNASFYVICGDLDGAAGGMLLSLEDPAIDGWGLTGKTVMIEAELSEETDAEVLIEILDTEENGAEADVRIEIPEWEETDGEVFIEITEAEEPVVSVPGHEELPDISDGPVFFIFAGGRRETQSQSPRFRLSRTVIDLAEYLKNNSGDYAFTLLDTNNSPLPEDEDGKLIVRTDTVYKLTMNIASRNGLMPGTYQYRLPEGVLVGGGTGHFILSDGTEVGTWEVTDEGLITMVFNDNMNSHTDITISATMGVQFSEQYIQLGFDGKITVIIQKPPEEVYPTQVNKWGSQGSGTKDPSKIYWTAEITGRRDSVIPGSIVDDRVTSGVHRYTQSDMAAGLRFGVSERDPVTGAEIDWHAWTVYPGDPGLTWEEDGWSYQMPDTVRCDYCGMQELGSSGWVYYIEYSSTPEPMGTSGALGYMNRITVDGQKAEAWVTFMHGETHADVVKTGSFHGDAGGGFFLWEISTVIPGMKDGQRAEYFWYLMDDMSILDGGNTAVGYVGNDAYRARVTAVNNGVSYTVPRVIDAGEDDMFAWDNPWSWPDGDVPGSHGRELDLFCRCNCTAENCPYWNRWNNNACCSRYSYWENGREIVTGFCRCWTVTGDTTITFSYSTEDLSVVENYGGLGNKLWNEAVLYNKTPDDQYVEIARNGAAVPIPGVFRKELTKDFDGYSANYTITVNEARLVLTDGTPFTIRDEMTQTLAYISGSLVITTEDADGNRSTLRPDRDYTVSYDGSGNKTDGSGKTVHVLDIVILRPQPVMYILNYDAALIIPPGTTQGVRYSNAASVTLWSRTISDMSEEKVHADINIAAKSYRVEIHKTDSMTGDPLADAKYGLFNESGGQITVGVTDERGELLFATNVTEGIILREHVLYYIQELDAPAGYITDDTKYRLCFCSSETDSCEICHEVIGDSDAFRIPFEQIGIVEAENEFADYHLPATGGTGIRHIVLPCIGLVLTSLACGLNRKRRS